MESARELVGGDGTRSMGVHIDPRCMCVAFVGVHRTITAADRIEQLATATWQRPTGAQLICSPASVTIEVAELVGTAAISAEATARAAACSGVVESATTAIVTTAQQHAEYEEPADHL
jgi:hypothetical protein